MHVRTFSTTVTVALLCALAIGAPQASAAVMAGNTGWFWANPSPQGNTLLAADAGGGQVLAAGESGTLVRSVDGGANWSGVRIGSLDPIVQVQAVGASSAVFATRCTLRRTDDGGDSVRTLPWGGAATGCAPAIAAFSFPSISNGYLVLADGSVKTTVDGGFAWQDLPPLPGTVAAGGSLAPSSVSFTSQTNGVAVAGNTILHTDDAGATWDIALLGAPSALRAVDFADAVNGFVVGDDGIAYTTADGGATFGSPLPAGLGVGQYALTALDCAADAQCVAVDPARGGIVAVNSAGTSVTGLPAGDAVREAAIDGNRLFAVGAGGAVSLSDDRGASWTRVGGRVDAVLRGLRATSRRITVAYGDSGALARTIDAGLSWQSLATGTVSRIRDASLSVADAGFAIDSQNAIHRVGGPGELASLAVAPAGFRTNAVYALSRSKALIVGRTGLYTWKPSPSRFQRITGVRPRGGLTSLDSTGSVLVAFGARDAFVAAKAARDWQRVKLPPTRSIVSLDFVSRATGYVLDRFGELWFTSDGGKRWRRIDATGDNAFSAIAFANATNGYLASASGRILRTADGGSSWARQFPFFDESQAKPLVIEATSSKRAIALSVGSNQLLATATGGQSGFFSRLKINRPKAPAPGGTVKIAGSVLPAKGGELVTVLARAKGARPGTKWISRTVAAGATGKFTTLWRITQRTVFVARWSGDAQRESSGAPAVVVQPRPLKR